MLRAHILGVALAFFVVGHGISQETPPPPPDAKTIESQRVALEKIVTTLEKPQKIDLPALLDSLETLRREARLAGDFFKQKQGEVTLALEALGAAPEEGEPAELKSLADQRKDLSKQQTLYDGLALQAELNAATASRLMAQVSSIIRGSFYNDILKHDTLPLKRKVLGSAYKALNAPVKQVRTYTNNVRTELGKKGNIGRAYGTLALALALALLLPFILFRLTTIYIDKVIKPYGITNNIRIIAIALQTLIGFGGGAISSLLVYFTLRLNGIISADGGAFVFTVAGGFVLTLLISAFINAALVPQRAEWRILPITMPAARATRFWMMVLLLIFFEDMIYHAAADILNPALALTIFESTLVSLALGATLWMLARRRVWQVEDGRANEVSARASAWLSLFRHFIQALAVVIMVASLVGYMALTHFIITRLLFVAAIAAFAWLTRALLMQGLSWGRAYFAPKEIQEHNAEKEETKHPQALLFFFLSVLVDFLIVSVALVLVLLSFGTEWGVIDNAVYEAFVGVKVGSFTFSFSKVLNALIVFFAVLGLTRLLQYLLEKQLFPHTRLEPGDQVSLNALLGYFGVFIALLSAIASTGTDMTKLAVIVGAISVGIGFGLQSIANNFFSGMILLFERPIKVGDWVVVNSGEGIVKRISVRSTEIQTFDHASIIVPNSELVSSTVTNWTHKDRSGRVIVPISVAYGEDPERVREILIKCANDMPKVHKYPEPYVYFKGFGDSSVDFELRVYIGNIMNALMTRNDLRFNIFKVFREEDIEIPFPQRDVHLFTEPEKTAPNITAKAEKTAKPAKKPKNNKKT
ncbi:MAG: hypothetical protein COA84_00045 [Robiginitomaculum sp.]|nr:MAG: hypothetical protein COA84_00045 [Robiginitomaculum sp.]